MTIAAPVSESVETITVVASDGATASLSFYPTGRADAPIVLCLPAMGIEARYYANFARELAQRGSNVAVLELRGLGTSSVRPSRDTDFGFGVMLEKDLPPALDAVRARFPTGPLFLVGHSLGGQAGSIFTAIHQAKFAGLGLIACGAPYYRCWPWPMRFVILAVGVLFRAIAALLGYFPGKHVGFAGQEARGVITEWTRVIRTGRFSLLDWSGPDPEEALRGLRLPVLGVSLEQDRFTPAPVMEHLLAKMPHAEIERFHYDYRAFGAKPVDHNRWPRHPEIIAERVAAWIEATAGRIGR